MKDNYPEFYWQMKAQLVREIRQAQTWSNKVEACKALINVNLVGENMRKETEYLADHNTDNVTNKEIL